MAARVRSGQRTRCEACLALGLAGKVTMSDQERTLSVLVQGRVATLGSPLSCNGTDLYKSK